MNDIPVGLAVMVTGVIFGALVFMGAVISAIVLGAF